MLSKEKPVTTLSIWNQTWQLLAQVKRPFLQIGLFAVFLPALLMSFFLASWSMPLSEQIKSLVRIASSQGQPTSYQELFGMASPFLFCYLGAGVVLVSLVLVAFFALIKIAVAAYCQEPPLSSRQALALGLRMTFPSGFVLLLLLLLLSMEQVLFGPFHVFTLFCLMAPVIMIAENRRLLPAVRNAVFFRYTSPVRGGGFSSSFVLLSLSAMIYGLQSLLQLGTDLLLHADEWLGLPRSLWALQLPGLPFSPVFALAKILNIAIEVLLLVFVVGFLVSLFFRVRPKVSQRV